MTDRFVVRPATPGDVAALARHRVEMYRDMGVLPDESVESLRDASASFLAQAMADGRYLAWVAMPVGEAEIVAGAGLLIRPSLPRARRNGGVAEVTGGQEGLVCNVFTERAWRRQGLGRRVTQAAIDAARAHGLARLFLHASDEGRPLYESLGFVASNEMRYAGPL